MKIQLNRVQALILSMILTATFFAFPKSAQAASLFCQQTLAAENSAVWRPAKGNLFMAFRSNAAHFWNWIQGQDLFPAMMAKGIVIGDAYILNFRDVPLSDGKREFTLVDIDDAGVASLLADFMRFYIGNQVSPYKVSAKDLWQAYLDGLHNVRAAKPEVIKKAESEKYTADEQHDFVDKLTSGKKFNAKAELESLASASASVKKLFKIVDPIFRKELTGEILDMGFKINTEGGSQGLIRFWYLVKDKKTEHIFEFKQETAPATASYGAQPSRTEVFTKASAIYRPTNASGLKKILTVKSEQFLMRERQKYELNFDPAKTDEKLTAQAKEVSIYIANMIGQGHFNQTGPSASLRAELQRDPQAFEKFSNLAERYISLMAKENK